MIIITKSHKFTDEITAFLSEWGVDLKDILIDVHEALRSNNSKQTWDNIFKVNFMDAYNDPELDTETKYIIDNIKDQIFDTAKLWISNNRHLWILASSYELINLIIEKDRFIYEYGNLETGV